MRQNVRHQERDCANETGRERLNTWPLFKCVSVAGQLALGQSCACAAAPGPHEPGLSVLLTGDEKFAFIPLFHARMLLALSQLDYVGRYITCQFAHRDETVVVFIRILA